MAAQESCSPYSLQKQRSIELSVGEVAGNLKSRMQSQRIWIPRTEYERYSVDDVMLQLPILGVFLSNASWLPARNDVWAAQHYPGAVLLQDRRYRICTIGFP